MVITKSTVGEKLVDFLVSLLLSWGIGTASLLCLWSAFPLPVDTNLLIYTVGLCSMGTSIAYLFSKGWIAVSISWIIGFGTILIWYADPLVNGTKMLLDTLLAFYSSAYHQLPHSIGDVPLGYTATLPMCLWGTMIATLCAWSILRRQTPVGVLILSAFPLALCMVVVDTPPDRSFLFQYLISVALLVLTQGCRRRNLVSGSRLCLLLIIPTTLLVLGLHEILPQWSYTRKPWSDNLLQQAQNLLPNLHTETKVPPPPDVYNPSDSENSLIMNPPRYTDRPIMEVTAETSGTIYLRGNTYGEYRKDAWNIIDSQQYLGPYAPGRGLFLAYDDSEVDCSTMHIRTYGVHELVYTPYYLTQLPSQGSALQDCAIQNSNHVKDYDISYCAHEPQALSSPDYTVSSYDRTPYDYFVWENYTKLPWGTRRKATDYLQAHGFTQPPITESNPSPYAERIAQLVRSSATYDINTPAMPEGENFVMWFLEESPTGYCVHFASASVVLLRAAGIPARYVTGYLVNAEAGTPTTVLDSNAHAWAEYYVYGIGWIPLEATPSDALENILHPDETTQPEETTQPDTTEETTSPTESTAATEGTTPSESALSTAEGTTPDVSEPSTQIRIPGWIFLIPVLVLLALAYRPTVLLLRRRKLQKLSDNEAFLLCWHYCSCMARWLKVSQNACTELALKARFSQHTMDKEDWKTLHNWQDSLRSSLPSAPFIKRFLIHRILLWDQRL